MSKKIPAAISEYMAAIGQRGGAAKVPKGFAALTAEERRQLGKKAAIAKKRKNKAALKAARNAT